MFEKPCRCGKTKKRFKKDIGPFFINQCCRDAGYDNRGELVEAPKEQASVEKESVQEPEPEKPKKPSKRTLKNMKVAELKELAEQMGLEVKKGAKKAELVDAILES